MTPPASSQESARDILPLAEYREPNGERAADGRAEALPPGPEARPLSLRRDFAWTLIGNLAFAGCQWGILIVLAKLGTPEMVGQFSLGLALTAPIFMFSNLQLRSVQATDSRREFCFGDYLGLRLTASLLALATLLGISFWSGYRPETTFVVMMVAVAKCLESISDIFYGLFQQQQRFERIAKSMALNGGLALVALTLGVWLSGGLLWGAFGFAVTRSLMILAYDLPNAARILQAQAPATAGTGWMASLAAIRPTWQWPRLFRLAGLGLPLGGTTLLVSLHSNFPRYFLAEFQGEYELGIFSAIAALMTAGTMIFRALDQSSSPRLAQLYNAGDHSGFRKLFVRVMLLYSAFGLAGIVAAAVAGGPLLSLLFQPEYAAYPEVLLWIMIAASLSYVMGALMTALIATRRLRPLFPMLCVTAGTSFVLCGWLIPHFGMVGAAQAITYCKVPFVLIGFGVVWRLTRGAAPTPASEPAAQSASNAPREGRPNRCAG